MDFDKCDQLNAFSTDRFDSRIAHLRAFNKRLNRLFNRYNQLYWHGKLAGYRVIPARLQNCLGQCEWRKRSIKIDVLSHRTNRELRSTLLHEMCHAAAGPHGSRGHDLKFFEQMEMLLKKGAPVTVHDPEAGKVRILREVVPARFRLLKRKMERLDARRRNKLEHLIKAKNLKVQLVSDDDIVREFEDHAWELSWKEALITIGLENGLIDETGRPLNQRYRRLLARARKAHSRARRQYLDEERRHMRDPENFLVAETHRLLRQDG